MRYFRQDSWNITKIQHTRMKNKIHIFVIAAIVALTLLVIAILIGARLEINKDEQSHPLPHPIPPRERQTNNLPKDVYMNTKYGFQFTMPKKWMDMLGDYTVAEITMPLDNTPLILFGAKATEQGWKNYQEEGLPKGYAQLFHISVIKKTDWEKDMKTCDANKGPCTHSAPMLGQNESSVFILGIPHESPSNFTMFKSAQMEIENPTTVITNAFSVLTNEKL